MRRWLGEEIVALEQPKDPANPFNEMDRLYKPPHKDGRFTRIIIDEPEKEDYNDNSEEKGELNDGVDGTEGPSGDDS
jgi:hypothetical protein